MYDEQLFAEVKASVNELLQMYFDKKKLLGADDSPGIEKTRELCDDVLNNLLWLQAEIKGELRA